MKLEWENCVKGWGIGRAADVIGRSRAGMPVPLFRHGLDCRLAHPLAGRNKLARDWWAAEIEMIRTLELLHSIPRQRFGAMSVAEKWEVAKGLLRTARETRRAGLALRHPDWSSEKIERELARELARART